jgi:hypothetical protein
MKVTDLAAETLRRGIAKRCCIILFQQQLLFERKFHSLPRSNPTQNLGVSISSTSKILTASILVLFVVLNK